MEASSLRLNFACVMSIPGAEAKSALSMPERTSEGMCIRSSRRKTSMPLSRQWSATDWNWRVWAQMPMHPESSIATMVSFPLKPGRMGTAMAPMPVRPR